jgi:hypothetical protein
MKVMAEVFFAATDGETRREMVPTRLFWCLRREINNRSFEDVDKTYEELVSSFYHTLFLDYGLYVLFIF